MLSNSTLQPKEKAQILLDKAVFNMLGNKQNTFINGIYYRVQKEWSNVGTACTNGTSIVFDPDFFCSLRTDKLRVFVIAHEVWHIALRHMIRYKHYDKAFWHLCQIAGDEVINNMLKKAGYEIWDKAHCSPEFADMSFEQIMVVLIDRSKKNLPLTSQSPSPMVGDVIILEDTPSDDNPKGGNQPSNDSLFKDITEAPAPAKIDPAAEEKIAKIILQAAIEAHAAGYAVEHVCPELELVLKEILNPKIPWRSALGQWMLNCVQGSYSYAKPRKTCTDFILPSLTQDKIALVTIYFDVSGSIEEEMLKQFYSDLSSLATQMEIEKIKIVTFNTDLQETFEFTGDSVPVLNIKIGGGTNIYPVLEQIQKEEPNIAVIFTDGDFKQPTKPWNGNLLWISSTNWKAPFGTTINM